MGELRAAVYARTSSDQHPIGQQLAELRGRVADDEVRVPAEWEFVDDGSSGVTLVPPGLDRVRTQIAAAGIERLYVQSPEPGAHLRAASVAPARVPSGRH